MPHAVSSAPAAPLSTWLVILRVAVSRAGAHALLAVHSLIGAGRRRAARSPCAVSLWQKAIDKTCSGTHKTPSDY